MPDGLTSACAHVLSSCTREHLLHRYNPDFNAASLWLAGARSWVILMTRGHCALQSRWQRRRQSCVQHLQNMHDVSAAWVLCLNRGGRC